MRILLLSPDVEPGGSARAGYVGALAAGLVAEGHEVTVMVRAHEPTTAERILGGARVIEVLDPPPLVPRDDALASSLHGASASLGAATSLLLDGHIDVVHAHDRPTTWTAVALGRIWDMPIVASIHGPAGRPDEAEAAAERWLVHEAKAVLVRSERRARDIAALDVPTRRIHVVRAGRGLARRALAVYEGVLAGTPSRGVAHGR